MITQQKPAVLKWMKAQVQDGEAWAFDSAGEVNMTALGEGAARKFPQAAINLGDGLDVVWDLAFEVLEWWEQGMPSYLHGQTCPLCESPTVVDTGNGISGDYTLSGGCQGVDLSRLRCESCKFTWLA